MKQYFSERVIHVGRNIQKFRLLRDKSQGDVAADLEELLNRPVSQQFISDLENKEIVEDDLLEQIGKILRIEPTILKTMDWNAAINLVNCTFNDHANSAHTINQTIHPFDHLAEIFRKEITQLKLEIDQLKKQRGA